MANYVGNIISNAGTGAAAGGIAGGGWGALAGGVIGGLGGLFNSLDEEEDEERKAELLKQAQQQLNLSNSEMQQLVDDYYASNPSIGSEADVAKYKELVADYDPNEFVYDFDEFNDDYDVNDYYAANKDAIIQKTSDALQHTAAGAGIGRGTGAANQIATGVANKNEELYKDALDAMNQDRTFAYNLWNSNIQNQQNKLNQLKSAADSQLSLYGNLADDYQTYNQNKLQTQLDLANNNVNNQLQLTLAGI